MPTVRIETEYGVPTTVHRTWICKLLARYQPKAMPARWLGLEDCTFRRELHHIGVGRTHKGRSVMLVADTDVRIIDAGTGELIRQLTLDPTRGYQPRGST